jgi:hypothetical protein
MRVKLWLPALTLLVAGIAVLQCSVVLAQSKPEYRKGRLLKVNDATDILDTTHKAAFLLLIQDGSDQYVGHYTVTYFGHVNKSLLAGSDIEFRLSGKHLFLKTPDGKEIKARLCDRAGEAVRCGNVAFSPAFPPEPATPRATP